MCSSRPAEGSQLMSVQDPDASNEDTDEVLTRQFAAFGDALGDDCPAVRAEAVTGLAGLLDTFWELVPGAVTAGFLQRIVGESNSTSSRYVPPRSENKHEPNARHGMYRMKSIGDD